MRTTWLLALAALLAVPALPGCLAVAAGAAAGVGIVKYTENGAYQDFRADEDEVWEAVADVLDELAYPVPRNLERAKLERELEVDDVDVRVEPRPDDLTRVHVRVGTFETQEHERRARAILARVEEELG